MFGSGFGSARPARAISTPVGVVLMVLVLFMLVGVATVVTTGLADEAMESAQPHGIAKFDVDVYDAGSENLSIAAEQLGGPNSTYDLRVNGHAVHRWDGRDPLDLTCLYPGDHVQIVSRAGDTTSLVREHRMERSLQCERIGPIPEKFEYAYVNDDRVRVQEDFSFSVGIDPDGPGPDRDFGNDVHERDIGPVPVTNKWHYVRRYDRRINGYEPPVWVIVMTDNVHWREGTGYDGYNWTDDPPSSNPEPGIDSYTIDGGSVNPEPAGSEPTNDIYLVFKPGCSESEMQIVDVDAGYDNRIYVNGDVAIEDTFDYSRDNASRVDPPVEIDAPGVNCPGM